MKKKRLLKYLRGNRDYTFKIKNYLIPKQFVTIKNNPIDLEKNRENNLEQGSTWSPKFRKFLDTKHKSIGYIREFPLIIKDQKLWLSLCKVHQVPKGLWSRNYFMVDYFIHDYNFIVEIDSQYHNEEYDKARDDYIKREYGLDIIRFYEYGKDANQKFLNDFEFLVNYCRRLNVVPVKIKYSNIILESYKAINGDIIKIIDKIESFILQFGIQGDQLVLNNINSKKELKYLSDYYDKYTEVQNYIRFTYNIDVIITPSNP